MPRETRGRRLVAAGWLMLAVTGCLSVAGAQSAAAPVQASYTQRPMTDGERTLRTPFTPPKDAPAKPQPRLASNTYSAGPWTIKPNHYGTVGINCPAGTSALGGGESNSW